MTKNNRLFGAWIAVGMAHLSGGLGEELIGIKSDGKTDDYRRWIVSAKKYLSNHLDVIFYPEPQDSFEFEA